MHVVFPLFWVNGVLQPVKFLVWAPVLGVQHVLEQLGTVLYGKVGHVYIAFRVPVQSKVIFLGRGANF